MKILTTEALRRMTSSAILRPSSERDVDIMRMAVKEEGETLYASSVAAFVDQMRKDVHAQIETYLKRINS